MQRAPSFCGKITKYISCKKVSFGQIARRGAQIIEKNIYRMILFADHPALNSWTESHLSAFCNTILFYITRLGKIPTYTIPILIY